MGDRSDRDGGRPRSYDVAATVAVFTFVTLKLLTSLKQEPPVKPTKADDS